VNGQWRYEVRYFAVSLAALFPLAFVLLVILLINGESTFQWLAAANNHEPETVHKLVGWNNYTFLVIRQLLGLILVAGFFGLFIKYQHKTSTTDDYKVHRTFRNIALVIPGIYILYGTMIAWDFEMTQVPGWHSASYGVYQFVSMFGFFLAFFALMLFIIKRSGKATIEIKNYVFNFLAQMMLGFTILWTYFFFTQYLIMWYGRLPEEMDRFHGMMQNDLAPLWWTFVACKFIIPLVTFATWTPNRHNPKVIVAVACVIMFGTWIERYTWISGSVDPQYYHIPMTSIMDIVYTVVTFAAVFAIIRWSLNRYGLIRT